MRNLVGVLAPTGIKESWNAGFCCGYAYKERIDDLGYLMGLLSEFSGGGGNPVRLLIVG